MRLPLVERCRASLRQMFAAWNVDHRVLMCVVAIKGVGFGMVSPWFNKAAKYYFSAAHVDANSRSVMMSIATLPWAFRPMLDAAVIFPTVRGQRNYLTLLMVGAVFAFLTLGSFAPGTISPLGVTALFVLVETALCAHDVVANGMVSKSIRINSAQSHEIASMVWIVRISFQLLGLGFIGIALKRYSVLRSFSPCLAALAFLVWILVSAHLHATNNPPDEVSSYQEEGQQLLMQNTFSTGERKVRSTSPSTPRGDDDDDDAGGGERHCGKEQQHKALSASQQRTLFAASLFIGTTSATISIAPLLGFERPGFLGLSSAIAAIFATSALDRVFGREIAMVNGYRMLINACQPDLRAVTFVFYTDGPSEYPKGPHLDPFFYSAIMGYVARSCALIGICLYRSFLSDWSFKGVFRLSAFLSFLANVSALPVYLRLFRGEPRLDLGFILFEEAIRVIVKNLKDIPSTVLSARCCRKGNDATILALCGAAGHLTEPVQTYTAIMLLNFFNVNPSSRANDGAHLRHLWKVKLICGALVLLPPLFFLDSMIPNGGPNDELQKADLHRNDSESHIPLSVRQLPPLDHTSGGRSGAGSTKKLTPTNAEHQKQTIISPP